MSKAKPLPQAEGIQFLFGCETEMDQLFTIGLAMLPVNASDAGTLLVACHTPSDNRLLCSLFARVIHAFGLFVEEYG